MQPQRSQIKRQIEHIESLFENKQLDEFVQRVEQFILPHYEKCKHTGKYKEKVLIQKQEERKDDPKEEQKEQQDQNRKAEEQKLQVIQKQQQQQQQTQKSQLNIMENNEDQHDNKPQQLPQEYNQEQLILDKQQISTKDNQKTQQEKSQPPPAPTKPQQQQSLFTQSLSEEIKQAVKHSKIHLLQKYDEMKLVLFKIQRQMQKLETPMSENKQWKVNKINATSSIGVKTKGTLVQIRYEAVVETNIFNLCVMIYLSELYKQWVPFCTGSKTITEPSPLEKIVLMDMKIPFLTQRYAYLHGIAIDRITKNGKLYIYAEGITHQKQLLIHVHKADKVQYEKKVAKSVVLDAKYMVCEIGNDGNGKYQVKVYGMVDTHMPLLPEKVVNYIVKQLGGMIFDKIVKRAKDIKNTAWEKQLKLNEKREQKNKFYSWLNERITNWDKTEAMRKSKM